VFTIDSDAYESVRESMLAYIYKIKATLPAEQRPNRESSEPVELVTFKDNYVGTVISDAVGKKN